LHLKRLPDEACNEFCKMSIEGKVQIKNSEYKFFRGELEKGEVVGWVKDYKKW